LLLRVLLLLPLPLKLFVVADGRVAALNEDVGLLENASPQGEARLELALVGLALLVEELVDGHAEDENPPNCTGKPKSDNK